MVILQQDPHAVCINATGEGVNKATSPGRRSCSLNYSPNTSLYLEPSGALEKTKGNGITEPSRNTSTSGQIQGAASSCLQRHPHLRKR